MKVIHEKVYKIELLFSIILNEVRAVTSWGLLKNSLTAQVLK